MDLYVAVDTLEYLRKGGRLSAAQSVVGNILSVKPLITVRDGQVVMAERQRSRAKARARVVELIAAHPVERLAIVHTPTSTAEEVQAFRDALVAALPDLPAVRDHGRAARRVDRAPPRPGPDGCVLPREAGLARARDRLIRPVTPVTTKAAIRNAS